MMVAPLSALAEDAPISYKASPEVYKLIGENEQFRVVLATFKPGQRDAFHSHPGNLVAYPLTNCTNRFYTPDGKFREAAGKKGAAIFTPATSSHSVQNTGKTRCQVLIVERK